jgi:hypothetical protein
MKVILLTFLATLLAFTINAQNIKYHSTNGMAIKGYDPVAYFLQQQAIEGSDQFLLDWSGSKWKFISQANLDSFKLAPQKYAPQYGGYCAYGMSEKHEAPTDPNAWTIVGNKLYLNYNAKVQTYWLKDTSTKIKAANNYWQTLHQ